MGANPKGILLWPSWYWKDFINKAVAGETNSVFLLCYGSEFVEKYVGVGAKRVRSLFERVKRRKSPSIVLLMKSRHWYLRGIWNQITKKDQNLNQLLVEIWL